MALEGIRMNYPDSLNNKTDFKKNYNEKEKYNTQVLLLNVDRFVWFFLSGTCE